MTDDAKKLLFIIAYAGSDAGRKALDEYLADVANVRAALKLAVRWMGDPDDALGTFEDIGDWFYRETGFLRPGKSEPLECGDRSEEREKAWKEWTVKTRAHVLETCRAALTGSEER